VELKNGKDNQEEKRISSELGISQTLLRRKQRPAKSQHEKVEANGVPLSPTLKEIVRLGPEKDSRPYSGRKKPPKETAQKNNTHAEGRLGVQTTHRTAEPEEGKKNQGTSINRR